MNTVTLTDVKPREETVEQLIDHCSIQHEQTSVIESHIEDGFLENNGNTMEVSFDCPWCTYSVTEVYVLQFIEQVNGDIRCERGTAPTCVCDEFDETHSIFNEIKRRKDGVDTAVAIAECEHCAEKWKDVFKYETIR